jgi:hypothetical protein
MWRQAAEKNEARLVSETKAEEQPVRDTKQTKKMAAPPVVITVGAPSANALAVREDAHLLATIRGLKLELAAKDKELVKIRRDLDECTKTNRRLQRERERQLGVVTAPPRQPGIKGKVTAFRPYIFVHSLHKVHEINKWRSCVHLCISPNLHNR